MSIDEILKESGYIDINLIYGKYEGKSDKPTLEKHLNLFYQSAADSIDLDLGLDGLENVVLSKTNRLGVATCELRIGGEFIGYCENTKEVIEALEQFSEQ